MSQYKKHGFIKDAAVYNRAFWNQNVVRMPFHTGQRYQYLPFTMYPGSRGYRRVNFPASTDANYTMASAGVNPFSSMLPIMMPLLNQFMGSFFGSGGGGGGQAESNAQGAQSSGGFDLGNLFGGLFGGGTKSGSFQKQASKSDIPYNPKNPLDVRNWNPIIIGTLLGSGLGAYSMISSNRDRLKDKGVIGKLLSNPGLLGLLVGGISGGAFGLAADQIFRFMADDT